MLDEKLKEKNFCTLILKKEKLEPLEYLIEKNSKILELLNKKKLDYGAVLKREEIPEAFKEVRCFTKKFLEVKFEDPEYDYYSIFMEKSPFDMPLKLYGLGIVGTILGIASANPLLIQLGIMSLFGGRMLQKRLDKSGYYPDARRIILEKEPEANLKPTLAHEYDHYLQYAMHCKDISLKKYFKCYASFSEGHARGVQRAASYHFTEKYDNEAYIKQITDMDVGELRSTYKWMCAKLGISPNNNLLKTRSIRDQFENDYLHLCRRPTIHATGNAILSIEEEKHGKEIYKKLLHGDTSFLS